MLDVGDLAAGDALRALESAGWRCAVEIPLAAKGTVFGALVLFAARRGGAHAGAARLALGSRQPDRYGRRQRSPVRPGRGVGGGDGAEPPGARPPRRREPDALLRVPDRGDPPPDLRAGPTAGQGEAGGVAAADAGRPRGDAHAAARAAPRRARELELAGPAPAARGGHGRARAHPDRRPGGHGRRRTAGGRRCALQDRARGAEQRGQALRSHACRRSSATAPERRRRRPRVGRRGRRLRLRHRRRPRRQPRAHHHGGARRAPSVRTWICGPPQDRVRACAPSGARSPALGWTRRPDLTAGAPA